MKKTAILTEGAAMIAMATVLSFITIYTLPTGGSITAASMVPILIMAFRHDTKWAILTSVAHAIIQMISGFYPPPSPDIFSFVLVILLDYIIAFGALGLAGWFGKAFKNKTAQVAFGSTVVILIRYICHILSGILIWSSYAPEGQPVWLYSVLYNGSYMGIELIISVCVMLIICKSFKTLLAFNVH